MQISHFTALKVYQKAGDLAARLFIISTRWPAEERYSPTDQIRRCARSVEANPAEAWGQRRYDAHFVSKLTDADAENHELEHWLLTARRDGYITQPEFEILLEQKREVGRMLGAILQNPSPFLLHWSGFSFVVAESCHCEERSAEAIQLDRHGSNPLLSFLSSVLRPLIHASSPE